MNYLELLKNITSALSRKLKSYDKNPELVNVGNKERVASVAGGVILSYYGLKKVRLSGLLTAITGGFLIFRGVTGFCAINKVIGRDSTNQPERVDEKPQSAGLKKDRFSIQKETEGTLKKQLKPVK